MEPEMWPSSFPSEGDGEVGVEDRDVFGDSGAVAVGVAPVVPHFAVGEAADHVEQGFVAGVADGGAAACVVPAASGHV
ncbi:hypothetical protein, partial [Pseudonocardia sp. ICBG601]|uniref:hypothetical protein n=1 Tax=Pseudonocardia sp. ICBG601 TaxID=2846759 RepID=UPI001CF61AA0